MVARKILVIALPVIAALLGVILTINYFSSPFMVNNAGKTVPENDQSNVIAAADNDNLTCLYDQLKTQELKVTDANGGGSVLREVSNGKEVLIVANVSNDCKVSEYPIKEVIEVRDSSGTTSFLVYMNTTVNSNQQFTFGAMWKPDKPGDYVIRATTIHCPHCLSYPPIATYNITVRE
jgi:hypothetical protein